MARWEYADKVTLDLRKLRPLVQDLPPEIADLLIKRLRDCYPEAVIDLTPQGWLRVELTS